MRAKTIKNFLLKLMLLGRTLKIRNKYQPSTTTLGPIVIVDDILGKYKPRKSFVSSVAIHIILITCILSFQSNLFKIQKPSVSNEIVWVISAKDAMIYMPFAQKSGGGGGGGGDRSLQPASKGKLPKVSKIQLAPPTVKVENKQPQLVAEPTVIAPPEIQSSDTNSMPTGDPSANSNLPSNGPGHGGGIGSGEGGGIGPGSGPGVGPGSGGGTGGGVFQAGGGVIAPQLIYKVDPKYSEEARKAKHQGIVILYIEVDMQGNVRKTEVRQSLGMGLDENAIEAVKQWRFKPGIMAGQPVIVGINVEIVFRML